VQLWYIHVIYPTVAFERKELLFRVGHLERSRPGDGYLGLFIAFLCPSSQISGQCLQLAQVPLFPLHYTLTIPPPDATLSELLQHRHMNHK